MATVSDEARIRELAEIIRSKCAQMQQQIRQQPPGGTTVTSASGAINPQNEVRRRLKEAVLKLHENVRDSTLGGIQQKLQFTAGKFGLSFSLQRSPGHLPTCYMSCESFFLEVCLEETGSVVSTKLVLGREQQNSTVLTNCLKEKNYTLFENHVRALNDMFNQHNGQDKSGILLQVIKATEQILMNIFTSSNKRLSPADSVLISPLGLVTNRQAGLPMNLMFYVTPKELLHASLDEYGIDSNPPDTLGVSAKIRIERSTQIYQLPKDPNLFDTSKNTFVTLSEQNTISVPLTLVLCLTKEIPVCAKIMLKIQQTVYGADQTMPNLNTPHVNQLILQENKENISNPNKHLIFLPGQMHTYTGLNSPQDMEADHRGVFFPNKKVPFTHPNHVISIINLLRQQLVYNTLINSCLQRKKFDQNLQSLSLSSFDDYDFTVVTKPPSMIVVATELLSSNGGSGTTSVKFEFIIPNDRQNYPTHPRVHVTVNGGEVEMSRTLDDILSRCLSIPVTIHAIFAKPSILPPSLAMAVSNHFEVVKNFDLQLQVAGNNHTSEENIPMETGDTLPPSKVTGLKRKRAN